MSAQIPAETQVIVFDAVGTLIYPSPSVADIYVSVISHYAEAPVDSGIVRNRIRQSLAERSDAVNQQTNEEEEKAFWLKLIEDLCPDKSVVSECFRDLFTHFALPASWRCFPDAEGVLSGLAARGYTTVIGSNFDSRLNQVCDALEPLKPAHHRVISSEIGWRKPSPEFFRAISRLTGVTESQILMIGDDLTNDVEGAQRAGCHAIWIRREKAGDAPDRYREVPQIASIQQLLAKSL